MTKTMTEINKTIKELSMTIKCVDYAIEQFESSAGEIEIIEGATLKDYKKLRRSLVTKLRNEQSRKSREMWLAKMQ